MLPSNCKVYVFYLPALIAKDYADLKEEHTKAGVTAEKITFLWDMMETWEPST